MCVAVDKAFSKLNFFMLRYAAQQQNAQRQATTATNVVRVPIETHYESQLQQNRKMWGGRAFDFYFILFHFIFICI